MASMNTTPFHTNFASGVRQLLHSLNRCAHLLRKAQHHAPDGPALLTARLAPDMLHLSHQVEVLADGVMGSVALLAGVDHAAGGRVFNRGEDLLTVLPWHTLDDAVARITHAQTEAATMAAQAVWVDADTVLTVRRPGNARQFVAAAFAERYAVPNALFHLSMIYALLRAHGVPIGKADFEGPPAYALVS